MRGAAVGALRWSLGRTPGTVAKRHSGECSGGAGCGYRWRGRLGRRRSQLGRPLRVVCKHLCRWCWLVSERGRGKSLGRSLMFFISKSYISTAISLIVFLILLLFFI
jgi:hypothetical protein